MSRPRLMRPSQLWHVKLTHRFAVSLCPTHDCCSTRGVSLRHRSHLRTCIYKQSTPETLARQQSYSNYSYIYSGQSATVISRQIPGSKSLRSHLAQIVGGGVWAVGMLIHNNSAIAQTRPPSQKSCCLQNQLRATNRDYNTQRRIEGRLLPP